MPKQGQHNNDGNDPDVTRGANNPRKSTPITTGTPKKRATYAAQAREHNDPGKRAQDTRPEWHLQTPRNIARKDLRGDSGRSGSDSNADTSMRGHSETRGQSRGSQRGCPRGVPFSARRSVA